MQNKKFPQIILVPNYSFRSKQMHTHTWCFYSHKEVTSVWHAEAGWPLGRKIFFRAKAKSFETRKRISDQFLPYFGYLFGKIRKNMILLHIQWNLWLTTFGGTNILCRIWQVVWKTGFVTLFAVCFVKFLKIDFSPYTWCILVNSVIRKINPGVRADYDFSGPARKNPDNWPPCWSETQWSYKGSLLKI